MTKDLRSCGLSVALALGSFLGSNAAGASAQQAPVTPISARAPQHLRVEYRTRPLGLDERVPRFSFELDDPRRGATQSACELAVGEDPQSLAKDEGVLWSSGRLETDATSQIEYAGPELVAGHTYWWKVRSFDAAGQASPWSAIETWSLGPLDAADWSARWIGDAAPIVKPQRAHNGWRSAWKKNQDDMAWVMIDLGQPRVFDSVRIHPAHPYDDPQAGAGYLFPLQYRVWIADEPTFLKKPPIHVVNETFGDVKNPGDAFRSHAVGRLNVRYVRIGFLKLAHVPDKGYGVALSELELLDGQRVVSRGAQITVSDSIEEGGWSSANLCDGDTGAHAAVDAPPAPPPLLRREFQLAGGVKRATLFASALGLYELHLNGERVGDQVLAPEWTRYDTRVQYQAYDVTSLLKPGANALGALLGDGWYAGRIGLSDAFAGYPRRGLYGDKPQLLVQLEIERADGSLERIVSDASWKSTLEGPIRASDLLDGETCDARNEPRGWDRAGFDDSKWKAVEATPGTRAKLVAQACEPIRVERDVPAVSVRELRPGVQIFDLGETLSGWCRLRCSGKAGTQITLRHAEMLDENGALYVDNLRGAAQTDRFTLRGEGQEVCEPRFTYHGFRYVEVSGLERPATSADLVGRSIRTSAREIGSFECSEPILNKLWRNARVSRRTNLVGVPTDAPARDERMGWLAPFGVAATAAMYDLDLAAFVGKWSDDVRDAQAQVGPFGDFAPHPYAPDEHFAGAPGWGDAALSVAWSAWVQYGDRRLLQRQFSALQRHVDYVMNYARAYTWSYQRGLDYGDVRNGSELTADGWPTDGCALAQEVFATAYLRQSTRLMSRIARAIGASEDPTPAYAGFQTNYGDYSYNSANAFDTKFTNHEARMAGDTQAGYALALAFDLTPEFKRARLVANLRAAIDARGGSLTTGIHTTHRALIELSRAGVAVDKLVCDTRFPSFGWQIEQGATAMWENRDGFVPGRGFNKSRANSFDALAGSSIGEWLSGWLVGLRPDEDAPGWKHFFVAPAPTEKVTWARGSLETMRGRIEVEWRKNGARFELDLLVPANSSASVILPATDATALFEGEQPIESAAPFVRVVERKGGRAVLAVQAGRYRLRAGS